jgi:hypothetical protein
MNMRKLIINILFTIVLVSCKGFPDIGGDYRLIYNAGGDIGIVNSKNTYIVYGHVLEYYYDSTYIIVAERPRDSVPECNYAISNKPLNECDEAFKKSTFRQFWIINKKNDSVWGPFKEEAYLFKRKELGIPDSIKIIPYR